MKGSCRPNKNFLIGAWRKFKLPIPWVVIASHSFKNCFDTFYLSHEIHLRKPNADIFNFVLKENKIKAENTLFIDDNSDNIKAAAKLGYHVWNLNPATEDITTLLESKKELF